MRRKCLFKLNLKPNVFALQEKVSLSDSPPTVESDLSSHLADTGDDTTRLCLRGLDQASLSTLSACNPTAPESDPTQLPDSLHASGTVNTKERCMDIPEIFQKCSADRHELLLQPCSCSSLV